MSFTGAKSKMSDGFQSFARHHSIWKEIEGNIALEEFIQNELAHVVLTGTLLSGELDAVPMQIVYDYIEERCFGGRSRAEGRYGRSGFKRKVISLIHRMHESLRVRSRIFGGKRYSCLCVVRGGE